MVSLSFFLSSGWLGGASCSYPFLVDLNLLLITKLANISYSSQLLKPGSERSNHYFQIGPWWTKSALILCIILIRGCTVPRTGSILPWNFNRTGSEPVPDLYTSQNSAIWWLEHVLNSRVPEPNMELLQEMVLPLKASINVASNVWISDILEPRFWFRWTPVPILEPVLSFEPWDRSGLDCLQTLIWRPSSSWFCNGNHVMKCPW